jgi:hypothetical protein
MYARGCTKLSAGARNEAEPSVDKVDSRKVEASTFPTSHTFLFATPPKCSNYRPSPQQSNN